MAVDLGGLYEAGCPRPLAALIDDTLSPGPCGLESCDPCGLQLLVESVALAASILDGGDAMVVDVTTQRPGLHPRDVGAFVLPKSIAAIGTLREHYRRFEAHWTIEQSEAGIPNLHVLRPPGSRLKLRRLRAVFAEAGVGRSISLQTIKSPLKMAAYANKIGLWGIRQTSDEAASVCLRFVRDLQGSLHLATPGFHLDPHKRSQRIERWAPHVIRWAETYDFEPKMPPVLVDQLSTLRAQEIERLERQKQIGYLKGGDDEGI